MPRVVHGPNERYSKDFPWRTSESSGKANFSEFLVYVVGASGGEVFCARDGRPVTSTLQITCEQLYWMEASSNSMGLIHDEVKQAFFTPDGELALSRDFVDLER